MIDRIEELNRLLHSIEELSDADLVADEESVLKLCTEMVIEGRFPNHEETLKFARVIEFVESTSGRARLTRRGQAFLALNPERLYELGADQRRFLVRGVFLDGTLGGNTRRLLSGFTPVHSEGTFRWSKLDSPRLEEEPWIIEALKQVGVLVQRGDNLEVVAEYVDTVAAFLAGPKGFSEDDRLARQKIRDEVGALAEKLALDFEASRLFQGGHTVESHCVRPIGRLRLDAGYDIESFDGASPDTRFDRFIEVKGSKGSKVQFIWSWNEMQVAKRLRSRYWIYFLGGIDLALGVATNQPLLFQDPIKSILKNRKFRVTRNGVRVEGGMSGAPVSTR